jgi:O-antigen/teichoic acid export membrane protein
MAYVTKAITEGDDSQARHFIRFFYLFDFLTSLVAFSGIALSALFLPHLLNLPPGLECLQALFGLTIVFQSTYWTSHALLRVTNRFSWTFYNSVGHSVIKTASVALLFVAKAGLKEVVLLLVGLSLLDGVSLFIVARLALRRQGLHSSNKSLPWWHVPGEIWRFQILGYGRELFKFMNRHIDTLMIGYVGSPLHVGLYRAGKQIIDQVQIPAQGLLVSLFPEYSRLYF